MPRPRRLLLLLILIIAAAMGLRLRAGTTDRADPAPVDSGRVEGIALGEIHPGYGLAPFREGLDRIRDLGASWVLLPVYGWVDSAGSPAVEERWIPPVTTGEYRRFTRDLVREAHRRGLKVLLVPYINLREGEVREWRGTLRPADWDRWFDSYRRFLDPWAAMAEEERVERFAVGAELVSSESHSESWRTIVSRVRDRYHGIVLYSCNWDHFRGVSWLDALDEVGISGYFSLAWDQPATDEALESLWRHVSADVASFRTEINRPVLFTEVGCPSIRGAAHDPWNYLMEGPPDGIEQARSLTAFTRVFRARNVLSGVFFWNWSPFRRGATDRSYSFQEKPAEGVVREWFLPAAR